MMKVQLATFLIWAVVGVGHAGKEVQDAARHILIRGFQVQHHGALGVEVISHGAGVVKALGLDKHHLQLRGGVNVDTLLFFLGSAAVYDESAALSSLLDTKSIPSSAVSNSSSSSSSGSLMKPLILSNSPILHFLLL